MSLQVISKAEFETMKSRWESLNTTYDAQMQRFLDDPLGTHFTMEEREKNKELQAELFELEETLQKVEAGIIILQD